MRLLSKARSIPCRRWRRLLVVLLMAAGGVAAVYGVANWKGQRDREAFFEWLKAEGYAASVAAYYGPAPNPEDDVFQHPAVVAEMARPHEERLGGIDAYSYEDRLPGLKHSRQRLRLELGEREDVREWFRPVRHETEAEAAEEILRELEPELRRMAEISEAFQRPEIGWLVEGDDLVAVTNAHMKLSGMIDFVRDVAILSLVAEDDERAVGAVDSLLRMGSAYLDAEPTLLSVLLFRRSLEFHLRVIQEGAMRGGWHEEDLARWEEALRSLDPQRAMVAAIAGELAVAADMLRQSEPFPPGDDEVLEQLEGEDDGVSARLQRLWLKLKPSGFAMSQVVNQLKQRQVAWIEKEGTPRDRFELSDLQDSRRGGEEPVAVPKVVARFALKGEAQLHLLRTGIALERYRLKHGVYPETLNELVPEFLPQVLDDPYDRRPLRYRRQEDGTPRVWSIDEDGEDDGGFPSRLRDENGDLIWIVGPIPGFSEADYK